MNNNIVSYNKDKIGVYDIIRYMFTEVKEEDSISSMVMSYLGKDVNNIVKEDDYLFMNKTLDVSYDHVKEIYYYHNLCCQYGICKGIAGGNKDVIEEISVNINKNVSENLINDNIKGILKFKNSSETYNLMLKYSLLDFRDNKGESLIDGCFNKLLSGTERDYLLFKKVVNYNDSVINLCNKVLNKGEEKKVDVVLKDKYVKALLEKNDVELFNKYLSIVIDNVKNIKNKEILDNMLFEAVKMNVDYRIVDSMIKSGLVNINKLDKDKNNALQIAFKYAGVYNYSENMDKIINVLIDNGINVKNNNNDNSKENVMLTYAKYYNNNVNISNSIEIFKKLKNNGADINHICYQDKIRELGEYPLYSAVANNNIVASLCLVKCKDVKLYNGVFNIVEKNKELMGMLYSKMEEKMNKEMNKDMLEGVKEFKKYYEEYKNNNNRINCIAR